MTEQEFSVARNDFMTILDKQPNVFVPTVPSDTAGAKLAEVTFGFIRKYCELKKKEVGPSQP